MAKKVEVNLVNIVSPELAPVIADALTHAKEKHDDEVQATVVKVQNILKDSTCVSISIAIAILLLISASEVEGGLDINDTIH